jgi:hypothetical protein
MLIDRVLDLRFALARRGADACGPERLRRRQFAVNLMRIRCPLSHGERRPRAQEAQRRGCRAVIGEMTLSDNRFIYVSFQGRDLRGLYRYLNRIPN